MPANDSWFSDIVELIFEILFFQIKQQFIKFVCVRIFPWWFLMRTELPGDELWTAVIIKWKDSIEETVGGNDDVDYEDRKKDWNLVTDIKGYIELSFDQSQKGIRTFLWIKYWFDLISQLSFQILVISILSHDILT